MRRVTLDRIQRKVGEHNWGIISKWIAQEKVRQDSSDYWTDMNNDVKNQEILSPVVDLFWENYASIRNSNEPCRATLDLLVEMSTDEGKQP